MSVGMHQTDCCCLGDSSGVIAQQAVGACIAAMREMETQRDTATARHPALLRDPVANACGGRCRKESSERRRLHHLLMEFRGNVRVFCRCVCVSWLLRLMLLCPQCSTSAALRSGRGRANLRRSALWFFGGSHDTVASAWQGIESATRASACCRLKCAVQNRSAVKPRAQMFEFDKVFGSNCRTKALWKEVHLPVVLGRSECVDGAGIDDGRIGARGFQLLYICIWCYWSWKEFHDAGI